MGAVTGGDVSLATGVTVHAGPDGVLEVRTVTDYPAAAACPGCGTISCRVHETVLARPGDVRYRAVRDRYGRRGRAGDLDYGIKNLLVRNLEHLSPGQFAKIIETLGDRPVQAGDRRRLDRERKAPPRAEPGGPHYRLCPCDRQVRDRLFSFYDWCAQHDDIPELITLARTISRWEDQITAAVITGITNAASEPEPPRKT